MKSTLRSLLHLLLLPTLLYLALFLAFTFPAATHFSTHFLCDEGDGFQNVWNIWWFNHALSTGQSPFYTTLLFAPQGVDLTAQTMTPLKGLLAALLLPFTSLVITHNLLVVFSFVASGLTAFWLAHYITRNLAGSLFAGLIFTFSSYHFAHAQGHMQLITMECIPLFFLAFWRLLEKPTLLRALLAAAALYLVRLSDLYYLFFCVLSALILLATHLSQSRNWRSLLQKPLLPALLCFATVSLATSGLIFIRILLLHFSDPLTGSHSPRDFSMHPLAPFIPGGHWRFAHLTEFFWSSLPGNIHESSIFLGLTAIALAAFAWFCRARFHTKLFLPWYILFWIFFLLALGPTLHLGSLKIPMPYHLLSLLPGFKLSGMPVRFIVISTLALSIGAAFGYRALSQRFPRLTFVLPLPLLALMLLEYWPAPIPLSPAQPAPYALALQYLPPGIVIDATRGPGRPLYHQTLHQQPLAWAYITREPRSANTSALQLQALLNTQQYPLLAEAQIAYLILPNPQNSPHLELLWSDPSAHIYRIRPATSSTLPKQSAP